MGEYGAFHTGTHPRLAERTSREAGMAATSNRLWVVVMVAVVLLAPVLFDLTQRG